MSKLILMRFLVQLWTMGEIEVLWQDHLKLCANITRPDWCIALNWSILIKGVPAPQKRNKGVPYWHVSLIFWHGELFKASCLCAAHIWGQETRCLLAGFGGTVLFQELGDAVWISPTFSQTDLFLSRDDSLIIGLGGKWRHIPERSGSWTSEDPSGLDSQVTQVGVRSFRMWAFAACLLL